MKMKTQIMIQLTNEDKDLIQRAGNFLRLKDATFCRMVILKESKKILLENKEVAVIKN